MRTVLIPINNPQHDLKFVVAIQGQTSLRFSRATCFRMRFNCVGWNFTCVNAEWTNVGLHTLELEEGKGAGGGFGASGHSHQSRHETERECCRDDYRYAVHF